MRLSIVLGLACVGSIATGCGEGASLPKCDNDDTFALIQSQIFEAKGCTNGACHGQAAEVASGGLDLRPENAYASLINIEGLSGDFARVFPGDQDLSLLYLKVAAKDGSVDLSSLGISGGAMPASGAGLSEDDLGLLRAWIRGGAPETGLVAGIEQFVSCTVEGDPAPNKISPLPPPAVNEGLQFYSGAWELPAGEENEICFVSYYDYSEVIPEELQIPCTAQYGGPPEGEDPGPDARKCFAYNSAVLAQDPQSHHSIVQSYIPPADKPEQWDPNDTSHWKNWTCLGGANHGEACVPGGSECGTRSQCTTTPRTTVACIIYPNGPGELGNIGGFFGTEPTRPTIVNVQEAAFRERYPSGVYGMMPVKGFVVWDSHAFNLTTHDTTIEQWMNLEYAQPTERQYERVQIFDAIDIFAMGTIEPFQSKEICTSFTIPQYGRLLTLSTHTHRYGKLFRVWFPPNEVCAPGEDCQPPAREPEYTSRLYSDPLYQRFTEGSGELPAFDSASDSDRTFRYCSRYENGSENPMEVRRESHKPDADTCGLIALAQGAIPPNIPFRPATCGCDPQLRECLGGPDQGLLCGGDNAACGAGGVCDACPLAGGVTTEDEMFILLGSYFVQEP